MTRFCWGVSVVAFLGCGGGELRLKTADGRVRTYRLHVPETLSAPAPLVIVLHGGGGNGEGAQNTMGLDPVADEEGFVVAYPDGTGSKVLGRLYGTWNSDEQCCGQALEEGVDDVAFISQLIDTLVADQKVDPKRVYATGLSNGGNMTHRLGCELSDKVAAISPMGAPRVLTGCQPSRPVPVMIVHGTADPCASFEDAPTCGGCFNQAAEDVGVDNIGEAMFTNCMGAETQGATWRAFNGCATTPEVTLEKGTVRCETYAQGCAAEVTVCAVGGGGHTVPGQTYGCDPKRQVCQVYMDAVGAINMDISLHDVWHFFEAHHLP